MSDKDDSGIEGDFVPYDHLTSKTRLLKSIAELEQGTEEPEPVEAAFETKACVSWIQHVSNWFRRN